MRIVFMGTPEFSVPILEALIEKYEVVLVVTQPDKLVGRHKTLTPSPIKEVAINNNIPCFQPRNIKEDYEAILEVKPDIIITAAYGQIIPSILLETPKYKAINVHASLLPHHRGGAPIHKAIMNGDKYSGVSIMYMEKRMDAGDIISQEKILINDDNTTKLTARLSILGRDLLLRTLLDIFSNNINPIKQKEEEATFSYNITKEEEKINWDMDAINVYNHIRGLSMVPGAYTTYNGKIVKIYEASYDNEVIGNPGEIVYNNQLGFQAKNGIVYPKIIQIEGKKAMPINEFMNGFKSYFKKNDKLF